MKIEEQVCSLELAKKLKELGVAQESLFKWHSKIDEKGNLSHTEIIYYPAKQMKQDYSAFTCAELGELIPKSYGLPAYYSNEGWVYLEGIDASDIKSIVSDTEANARVKMLVYLLKNDLINPRRTDGA